MASSARQFREGLGLALASLVLAAGCSSQAPPAPERHVAYMTFGHERAKAAIDRFREALVADGVTKRYRIVVDHAEVTDTDPAALQALVRRALLNRPDIVLAPSGAFAVEAHAVTRDVPIVFASRPDPTDIGLIDTFDDRPTNLVGFSSFLPIDWKRIELLRELAPGVKRIGIFADRWWIAEAKSRQFIEENRNRGIEWVVLEINDEAQLEAQVARHQSHVDAWYVTKTIAASEFPEKTIAVLRATHKPAVYSESRFVEMGGLISYDARIEDPMRIFARQVGLVLDGVPPSSIPVVRPKRFELAINPKAARELGLVIPRSLLLRADRVT